MTNTSGSGSFLHIFHIFFFPFVDIPLFGVAIMVVAAVVVSFSAKNVLDLCVLFIRIHKWLLCSPAAWYYVILMLSEYARTPNLFELVCRHNHRVVVCMYVVARLHENMPTDSPICLCIGMCVREQFNSGTVSQPIRLRPRIFPRKRVFHRFKRQLSTAERHVHNKLLSIASSIVPKKRLF